MLRVPTCLAAIVFAAFLVGGAVAIYGFNNYERAWGKFNSLQVYVWIGLGAAAIAAMAARAAVAAVAAVPGLSVPSWRFSLGVATVSVAIGFVTLALLSPVLQPIGLWGLAIYVALLSFLFTFGSLRWRRANQTRA